MQNNNRITYIALVMMILLSSCKPLKNVFIDQLLSPNEQFGANVKRVGIINRVTTDRTSGVHMDSDFLYFGEMRDGSNAAVDAINGAFSKSMTFVPVLLRDTLENGSSISMPVELNQETINSLCQKNNVQALVVIEYFKADFDKDITESDEEGYDAVTGTAATIFVATMNATFSAGIRVYQNGASTKQFEYGESLVFQGKGNTKLDAKTNLIKKRQAAETWGNGFGNSFAQQYLPHRYKMLRTIYVGKDKRFKTARKHVKNAEWPEAMALWLEIAKGEDQNDIPMALYNLALYKEVQGDFQGARTLLTRCVTEYHLKQARIYLRMIEIKINQSLQAQ